MFSSDVISPSDENQFDEISHTSIKTNLSPTSFNSETKEYDFKQHLICIRKKNLDRIIIAQLNINSIRNKFELLSDATIGNIDILMVSETKIDESFPISQFVIDGFSTPFRFDRNAYGGGILVYIREDIPAKLLNTNCISNECECLAIEINLHKAKWLLLSSYNPHKNNITEHLRNLSKLLEKNSNIYEKYLCLGDFNAEIQEAALKNFCDLYHLKSLVKEPTCFKNPDNPSCIDLFLTNCWRSFQDTQTVETCISDFHKMCITVLKVQYHKDKHNTVYYRNYKGFDNLIFKDELIRELSKHDINNIQFDVFESTMLNILNKHAPLKQKHLRANNGKFVTKELRKAIMKRSRLKQKFMKTKSDISRIAYKKQRNICVALVKKSKRTYFANLDTKSIQDNKKFWKNVSPLFSNKIRSKPKITLIENEKIITNENEIAETFNEYFSNIVKNLNISRDPKHISKTTQKDSVLQSVEMFAKHPSIISIKDRMETLKSTFSFNYINEDQLFQEIQNLDSKKASHQNDIPVKIIKENIETFSFVLYHSFNNSLFSCYFPSGLKKADVTPIFKKDENFLKSNYRPISILPKYIKNF